MKLVVKEKAEAQGYNIDRLARASGLDYNTVHRYWHNVIRRVDLITLEKLAQTLNLDPRELLEPDHPS
jgi:transcriptional regulator with XRE-family HTH domain